MLEYFINYTIGNRIRYTINT